ncbi:hypothetical protein DL93DRAFT_2087178 [Clavulina sp. PMI_390]|nr:hypothetical protein DL93DRAFT_2087178 [Clavulina sp. PMI_390]
MSAAKVHTQVSNRANKPKTKKEKQQKAEERRPQVGDEGRKAVFKSVLANPLDVKWPTIPPNVQNALLATLCRILEASGISQYHEAREKTSRRQKNSDSQRSKKGQGSSDAQPTTSKRKATEADTHVPPKKRRLDDGGSIIVESPSTVLPGANNPSRNVAMELDDTSSAAARPLALSHIVFGINEVTKRLEHQVSSNRNLSVQSQTPSSETALNYSENTMPSKANTSQGSPPSPPIRFVIACTQDVDPPTILAHFPPLVAVTNASRSRKNPALDVLLIQMPKMAEGSLTEAVKLRRTAVLALDNEFPGIEALDQFIPSIPILSAPWLLPPVPSPHSSSTSSTHRNPKTGIASSHPSSHTQGSLLVDTHVKQLLTSAPADMRAAKEKRAKGREEAKARAKLKKASPGRKANDRTKASNVVVTTKEAGETE